MSSSTSNHDDKPEIVREDQPVFRRMEIKGRQEHQQPLAAAPQLPAKQTPTAALRRNPVLAKGNDVKPASQTATSSTSTTPLSSWPAQPDQVQPLPVIYMLERTHVSVADTPAQEIGRRVVQCLQRESIAATCHDEEAVIDAETSECVQFSIRLWQAKEKGQVLVEVQKVQGCSYLYCQAAKAILAAAKGQAAPKKRAFPIPSAVAKHASSSKSTSPAISSDPNAMAKEGIEIAFTLLQRKRMDGRLMAVESLVQISKSAKHKNYAARAILCEKQDLRSTLLSMVEGKSSEDCPSSATPTSDLEKENARLMGRHALSVLANCLEALEQSGELASVVNGSEQQELCAQETLEALLTKVEACEEHPHEACQAVRCIGSLVRVSDACLGGVSSSQHVLAAAHATGGRCHARLEQECARLPASLL